MGTPERGELFRLVVRAEGAGPPAEIRLRVFLKDLLRRARLRCTALEQLHPAPPPAPPPADPTPKEQAP